jgi:hypothetical protein
MHPAGFGFRIGTRAAEELLDEADKEIAARERARDPKALEASAKAAAQAAREREKEAVRRERAIDAELRALKKRVAREKP